jgi:hypothetical protein
MAHRSWGRAVFNLTHLLQTEPRAPDQRYTGVVAAASRRPLRSGSGRVSERKDSIAISNAKSAAAAPSSSASNQSHFASLARYAPHSARPTRRGSLAPALNAATRPGSSALLLQRREHTPVLDGSRASTGRVDLGSRYRGVELDPRSSVNVTQRMVAGPTGHRTVNAPAPIVSHLDPVNATELRLYPSLGHNNACHGHPPGGDWFGVSARTTWSDGRVRGRSCWVCNYTWICPPAESGRCG